MTSRISASLPIGYTNAPPLRTIDGDDLVASPTHELVRRKSTGLLQQFLVIAESADTQASVLRFSKKWGLLQLCRHGLPAWHSLRRPCAAADSVQGYKKFAVSLDAMLRIGLELNNRRCGTRTDWQLANEGLSPPDFEPWSDDDREVFQGCLPLARSHFQVLMRRLTCVADLTVRFYWKDQGWGIDFD